MARDIFSVLNISPDLGLEEGAPQKRCDDQKRIGVGQFDLMKPGAGSEPVAKTLLGPDFWSLLQNMSDEGVEKLTISYQIERVGYAASYGDLQTSVHEYEAVRSNQTTYIMDSGESVPVAMTSAREAEESLRDYAGITNARVELGHANEAHHLSLLRAGPNLRLVLLRMWLLHLDLLAGAEVQVRVDNLATRSGLPAYIAIESECEFAKRLPGVRVHVNSLDLTAKALLCYACGTTAGAGLSERVNRYVWEPVPLVFYGGMMTAPTEVRLADAAATARAIVSFAEKYDMLGDCGEALRMAMHMYGSVAPANKLSLRLGPTRLHQQTHQQQMVRANYRCQELSQVELVSLAMLLGEGVDLACGYTLHAAVRRMGLHDTPGMSVYLNERALSVNAAADSLGLDGWLSNLAVPRDYVRRNMKYLYAKTGVLPAMCLGLIVSNTLLEDATSEFDIPSRAAGSLTDDVQASKKQNDDAAAWLILSRMLDDGLAATSASRASIHRIVDPDEVLDDAAQAYAGARVRMAVSGFGGSMTLRRMTQVNFSLQPTAPEVGVTNYVHSDDDALQSRMAECPANADARDWVGALLQTRGPMASTTTRRVNRAVPTSVAFTGAPSVQLADVNEEVRQYTDEVVNRGWGVQETSGRNLECGANALYQSLHAHHELMGSPGPTRDDVLTALRNSLDPEQREQAANAGVPVEESNFTGDQLANALRHLGPYSLGVIDDMDARARAWRIGDGEPIFVRHNANHWSGIGPGGERIGYPGPGPT